MNSTINRIEMVNECICVHDFNVNFLEEEAFDEMVFACHSVHIINVSFYCVHFVKDCDLKRTENLSVFARKKFAAYSGFT
jgi:hypothetical protein